MPLSAVPDDIRWQVDVAGGKPSRTLWKVLSRETQRVMLELTPVTGRTHQLRVHCSSQGENSSIVGDILYGPEKGKLGDTILYLHAFRLAIPHPRTGEMREFCVEADWRAR